MPKTMQAAVHDRYGPPEVVRTESVPVPGIGASGVLVRVESASLTTGDARLRAWRIPSLVFSVPARLMFGVLRPRQRVLGTTFAGTVERVGPGVTGFKPGDRVLGVDEKHMGAHAQLKAIDQGALVRVLPETISADHAAALPFGAGAAIYFLTDLAGLKAGQRLLVIGASGALGTAAVEYAKHLGAHVTAVCSGANHDLARALGADECIDYTKERVEDRAPTDAERYHAVYDTVGVTSFRACRHLLTDDGVYLPAVMKLRELTELLTTRLRSGPTVRSGVAFTTPRALDTMIELAGRGVLTTPIDSVFALRDITEAHRRADSTHKRGAIVVRVSGDNA